MKKIFVVLSVLLSITMVVAAAYAQAAATAPATAQPAAPSAQTTRTDTAYYQAMDTAMIQYENSPTNKLGRGALNTATFWAEIPAQALKVSKERDPLQGMTVGVAEGIFTSLLRGMTGIYDIVTFAIPPYDRPLMEPEYAFQAADKQIKDNLW